MITQINRKFHPTSEIKYLEKMNLKLKISKIKLEKR